MNILLPSIRSSYQVADSIFFELGQDSDTLRHEWQSSSISHKKTHRTLVRETCTFHDPTPPIIIAKDEADRLLPTPYREEFFSMLRVWSNNRAMRPHWDKLHLILVISTEPYLLIKDTHQSPFNVGHWLELDDFNEVQVGQLNQHYGAPVKQAELPHLMKLLGGHPYLTSVALYKLRQDRLVWPDLASSVRAEGGPFAEHLRHLHHLLDNEPDLKAAFTQVVHHQTCKDDIALFRLLKAGLVKQQEGQTHCRCDLYTAYFIHRL